MADENRHDGSDGDRRVSREQFDPADVELLPCDERGSCPLEICFASANCDNRLIEIVAGLLASDDSDRIVGERQFLRDIQETVDGQLRRVRNMKASG